MEKGYNVIQASELLCVKPRTVRDWIHNGTINAQKLTGTRRWIIMESEIKRMRNENKDTEYSE